MARPIQTTPSVGIYFNYLYVAVWVVLASGSFVGVGYVNRGSWWAVAPAAVVVWRALEILIWYLKALLDRTHYFLYSPERNLLFLLGDALTAVTITATLLRLGRNPSSPLSTWVDGLSVLTLNGRPSGYSFGWGNGATITGTFLGLMLLGAGLGLLVGLIQEKFEYGRGAYTGPRRIKRPRRA